jgi:hypothetical protein
MLVDLARGKMVLAVGQSQSAEYGGWASAFKEMGLPAPDGATVSFSNQEMSFAWRSHFVAACIAPLIHAAREAGEAKGWTVFELPRAVTAGVPDAMISMFGE